MPYSPARDEPSHEFEDLHAGDVIMHSAGPSIYVLERRRGKYVLSLPSEDICFVPDERGPFVFDAGLEALVDRRGNTRSDIGDDFVVVSRDCPKAPVLYRALRKILALFRKTSSTILSNASFGAITKERERRGDLILLLKAIRKLPGISEPERNRLCFQLMCPKPTRRQLMTFALYSQVLVEETVNRTEERLRKPITDANPEGIASEKKGPPPPKPGLVNVGSGEPPPPRNRMH